MNLKILIAFFIGALCWTILWSSCCKDKTEIPFTTCTNYGQDTIHYTTDIVLILNTYCNDPGFGSCHQPDSLGGQPNLDYTNYDNFYFEFYLGKIQELVLDPVSRTMPKSTSNGPHELTPCDFDKLQTWVSQGALFN